MPAVGEQKCDAKTIDSDKRSSSKDQQRRMAGMPQRPARRDRRGDGDPLPRRCPLGAELEVIEVRI